MSVKRCIVVHWEKKYSMTESVVWVLMRGVSVGVGDSVDTGQESQGRKGRSQKY